MKNRTLTKTTALVLLVTMIALVMISGTFAKYITEYDGEGTAIVAKWNVKITDLDGGELADDATFNLFDKTKVYDLDAVADVDDLSAEVGVVETDVAVKVDPTTEATVAPGTWGKVGFKITVDATNEVTVRYGIDITAFDTTLPLEFSIDGTSWTTAADVKAQVDSGTYSIATGTVNKTTALTDKTVTLYWRWLYESDRNSQTVAENDAEDTALGKAAVATCNITAKLGATQVD